MVGDRDDGQFFTLEQVILIPTLSNRDVHMPRFRCECQHHTCGETCDRCCAGYHQRRWRPATWEQSNACEACNCHGHAIDCYYDPEVERQQASLNIQGIYAGGGVCINCQSVVVNVAIKEALFS
ncbi:hypothetical protein MC885_020562 [Smutsia gigantea]|nr:hypothetical protein MC885_020562 [Smutsia gigantea]